MVEPHTPTTTAEFEYFMYRLAMRDLLQTLVSAGVLAPADATGLFVNLARKAREMPVTPEVEEYRTAVAEHFAILAEAIV